MYGYSFAKYFPIALSPSFVETVFFGEESLMPELESFKSYLSVHERGVFAKKPTAKVINLLSSNPAPGAEQKSLEHFKRFVKNLSDNDLVGLLQFLTGRNINVCETISVTFTTLNGNTRPPIVHTCGPTLEIPSTYQCYNELAEELMALLIAKDSWSFNIV